MKKFIIKTRVPLDEKAGNTLNWNRKESIWENKIELDIENGEQIGDEYHTIHELYQHRMALNRVLFKYCHTLEKAMRSTEEILNDPWFLRAKKHHDGSMYKGYFVVVGRFDGNIQISYHYELKHWDEFNFLPEKEYVSFPYDGHTSNDVIERLIKL